MEISDVLEDGIKIAECRDLSISMIDHIKYRGLDKEVSLELLKSSIIRLLQLKEKYEKISNMPQSSIATVKAYGKCELGEETFKGAVTEEIYNKL